MSPSEQCKKAGLYSLAELSRATGVSPQTLINWQRNKPRVFEVILYGAAKLKLIESTERPE